VSTRLKTASLVIALLGISIFGYVFNQQRSIVDLDFGTYLESENDPGLTLEELRAPYLREVKSEESNWDSINGTSIIAFNPVTSRTYYARNTDERRAIASITKLMTTLVVLDVYQQDDVLTVSKEVEIKDRSLSLQAGDKVAVSELLEAMLISSKNDAAELLAQEYENGYEGFIALMNEKADFLRMTNTHFSNASGYYDSENYSTADDLRILSTAVIKSQTVREVVEQRSGTFQYQRAGLIRSTPLITTNELLGVVSNIKGLKTGYTVRSGPSFIGYFVGSDEDQVITVILDSTDRFAETRELLNIVQKSFTVLK
jgi:D-alanyl-D-alanine carboxypeptidase